MTWSEAERAEELLPGLHAMAHRVYRHYMRSLWDRQMDEQYTGNKPREFYRINYGQVALFFCDTRGNRMRNWKIERGNRFLGNSQIKLLKHLVNTEAPGTIIFVSDSPFVGSSPSKCLETMSKRQLDTWPCHELDFYKIFLFAHKWARMGHLPVFLAGNSDCGYVSTIQNGRDSKTAIRQIAVGRLDEKWVGLNIANVSKYGNWHFVHNDTQQHSWASVKISERNAAPFAAVELCGSASGELITLPRVGPPASIAIDMTSNMQHQVSSKRKNDSSSSELEDIIVINDAQAPVAIMESSEGPRHPVNRSLTQGTHGKVGYDMDQEYKEILRMLEAGTSSFTEDVSEASSMVSEVSDSEESEPSEFGTDVAAPADFNGEKLIVDDGAEFSERLVAAMETQDDDDDNAGNDNQLNAEPRKRLILVKSM
jgi:hypothetical protein